MCNPAFRKCYQKDQKLKDIYPWLCSEFEVSLGHLMPCQKGRGGGEGKRREKKKERKQEEERSIIIWCLAFIRKKCLSKTSLQTA
jgi:hypothetical protein